MPSTSAGDFIAAPMALAGEYSLDREGVPYLAASG
jgi:hypothetical protein